MDIVFTKKVAMAKYMVDTSKLELYERNIGGGYKIVNMMDFWRAQSYWVVSRISRLEGKKGGNNYENYKIHIIIQ